MTAYVPITITNNQASATPAPFQQLINVNSALYGNSINSEWSNVAFTDQIPGSLNATFLQAWVESGASNTSNSTMVWVKLPKSIPPLSSVTIYMDFASTNVMSANGPTGEAAQLSPTLGQYDNIQNVMDRGLTFQIYYNSSVACNNQNYQNNLYNANLSDGANIISCARFPASTPQFNTPENGSTENVDGTDQPYVVINYDSGYYGGIAYPDPPVALPQTFSYLIKARIHDILYVVVLAQSRAELRSLANSAAVKEVV